MIHRLDHRPSRPRRCARAARGRHQAPRYGDRHPALRRVRRARPGGPAHISGRPVEIHDGYLVCPWLMPSPIPGVAEFALKLQEQTGCLLADVNRATVVDRELLLSQSYPQRVPRGEPESQAARGFRGADPVPPHPGEIIFRRTPGPDAGRRRVRNTFAGDAPCRPVRRIAGRRPFGRDGRHARPHDPPDGLSHIRDDPMKRLNDRGGHPPPALGRWVARRARRPAVPRGVHAGSPRLAEAGRSAPARTTG